MPTPLAYILLFLGSSTALAVGLLIVGGKLGPSRQSGMKQMPYESGMDPIHDARKRFDVRFHLVAIMFLVFDVELLFLYPWAVASRSPEGIDAAVTAAAASGFDYTRGLVFAEVMVFIGLLAVGLA